MAEKKKDTKTNLDTKFYSIEIKLTVQVLAENEKDALDRLDANGGYVTKREVEITNATPLNSSTTLISVQ